MKINWNHQWIAGLGVNVATAIIFALWAFLRSNFPGMLGQLATLQTALTMTLIVGGGLLVAAMISDFTNKASKFRKIIVISGIGFLLLNEILRGWGNQVPFLQGNGFAWGLNRYGQLGNEGTDEAKFTPVRISGPRGILDLAAGGGDDDGDGGRGDSHSLAVLNDGTVWAWGNNQYGQLGNGKSGASATSKVPVKVNNLNSVRKQPHAIAAGANHSLAVLNDGTVWAWGKGQFGALGTGDEEDSSLPVRVEGLKDVKVVAAGAHHSLALKNDGTVWFWGDGTHFGRDGDGIAWKPTQVADVPTMVNGLLVKVRDIVSGDNHILMLMENDTVWSWGDNSFGQLGIDSTGTCFDRPCRLRPGIVGISNVKAIAAGRSHSLAVLSDGTVRAWGNNQQGQLGTTLPGNISPRPITVPGLSKVKLVAAGTSHSVALLNTGQVYVWGDGTYGQLGDGAIISSPKPILVEGLGEVREIAAGTYHTMVALK